MKELFKASTTTKKKQPRGKFKAFKEK